MPPQPLTFRAPARVNLLGEHTDYTGGLVLPMAIPFHTAATIAGTDDDAYTFTSATFSTSRSVAREDRSPAIDDWSDYPLGVLRELQLLGIEPPPFTLHLDGNVPFGAGLSSSASVEVASCLAMLARAGHALLLNTRDLTTEHLPMNQGALADTQIVVCNSMVKHSVATGEYGVRRRELEEGQAVLREAFPGLRDLGDATIEQLNQCQHQMTHEAFIRCRHVVTENARVRTAREAMFSGDPAALGQLMLQAHVSYRDDFAASCDEVDFLVDTALTLPGCFGARLTGGGFGGCTVNLVDRAHAEAFAESLKQAYKDTLNLTAETYLCEAADGAIALSTLSDS